MLHLFLKFIYFIDVIYFCLIFSQKIIELNPKCDLFTNHKKRKKKYVEGMQTPPSLYVGKKYTAHIYMNWDGLKYPKQFCFNNFVQTGNKICITNCCFFGSNHLKTWSQWGPLISFHLLIEQFGVTTQRILKKTAAAGWGTTYFINRAMSFAEQ